MIKSFADGNTKTLFKGVRIPRWVNIEKAARRKLEYLHAACTLDDLHVPPGNRLEALKGDRKGQYSIRINEQFRICFTWQDNHAWQVEITDSH